MMHLSSGFFTVAGAYLAVISLIVVIVTVFDKIAAKLKHRRVPEATLLFLSMIGGSVAMLLTMLLIRHKTRHFKFMLGIPAIILLQLCLVFCFAKFFHIL